jgi:hypothetical protein
MITTDTLFDKYINVDLIRADGTADHIITPQAGDGAGRKPTIRVHGSLVGTSTLLDCELRITNLELTQPLSTYKKIHFEAGYYNAQNKGNISQGFDATVKIAFQELPNPDGVVCFQLFLGDIDNWMNSQGVYNFAVGASLQTVLAQMASDLHVDLANYITPDRYLSSPLQSNSAVKEAIDKLMDIFGDTFDDNGGVTRLQVSLIGSVLYAYLQSQGIKQDVVYELEFIKHASHNSAGYEIQAPWVPELLPGQVISVNPKYFKEDFGGQFVAHGNLYRILTLDYDFCTTDMTNTMSIVALGAA